MHTARPHTSAKAWYLHLCRRGARQEDARKNKNREHEGACHDASSQCLDGPLCSEFGSDLLSYVFVAARLLPPAKPSRMDASFDNLCDLLGTTEGHTPPGEATSSGADGDRARQARPVAPQHAAVKQEDEGEGDSGEEEEEEGSEMDDEEASDEGAEEAEEEEPQEGARNEAAKDSARRCMVCFSKEGDADVGDADELVTFSTSECKRYVDVACDTCEGFLRYQLGIRSRSEWFDMSRNSDSLANAMKKLSWHIALKRSEGCTKVSQKSLSKHIALSNAAADILNSLLERRRLVSYGTENFVLMGLGDYVLRCGNPLIAEHILVMAQVGGQAHMCVQVPASKAPPSERGLYDLQGVISSVWTRGGPLPKPLADLAHLRVDNLGLVNDVKAVAEGYVRHLNLIDQVGGKAFNVKPKSEGGETTNTASANELAGTPAQVSKKSSKPGSWPLSLRARRGVSPIATRSGCSTMAALAASVKKESGAPITTPRKASSSRAPSTGRASRTPIDKDFQKLEAKIFKMATYFSDSSWRDIVKGKERGWNNAIINMEDFKLIAASNQREDLHEDIDGFIELARSAIKVLLAGRFSKDQHTPQEDVDARSILPDVQRLADFLAGGDGDLEVTLAPFFRKLQAIRHLRRDPGPLCWRGAQLVNKQSGIGTLVACGHHHIARSPPAASFRDSTTHSNNVVGRLAKPFLLVVGGLAADKRHAPLQPVFVSGCQGFKARARLMLAPNCHRRPELEMMRCLPNRVTPW